MRPFTSANLVATPAYLNYISSLAAQQSSTAEIVTSQIVSGNAQGNIPLDDPLGGYSGYRGSVAELLVWPGVFIDWTSSTNRGYLHYFDNVTNLYRPLSVGHTGGGTPLGQPYVVPYPARRPYLVLIARTAYR